MVHGDDITSDSSGEDCYRFVKAAGRFKVVKRTPSISTTDLVGRMLLCTRTHFIKSLTKLLSGEEGSGTQEERKVDGAAMTERMKLYATDETGLHPGASVWFWNASIEAREDDTAEEKGVFSALCQGTQPKPGQRVVYVDGGFDLFSSGHIEFLRRVLKAEEKIGEDEGWYSKEAVQERVGKGADYGPAFVVAGVHDDEVINRWKGVNYPIMNIYERGLCVLQCKVAFPAAFCDPSDLFSMSIRSFSELPSRQLVHTSPPPLGVFQMLSTTDRQASCLSHTIRILHQRRWEYTERLDNIISPGSMLVKSFNGS